MHRRTLLLAFFSGVASAPVTTTAQPARKVYRESTDFSGATRQRPVRRRQSASNGHRYFLNLAAIAISCARACSGCIREPSF